MAKKRKRRHKKPVPISKKIYNAISVIAALLPLFFVTLVIPFFSVPNSGFSILGFVGALMQAYPVFFLFHGIKQKTSRKTIFCMISLIVFGVMFLAISVVFLFTPSLYNKINESVVTFYFFSLLLFSIMGLLYAMARNSIDIGFAQKGINKTTIRDLKTGIKNFWWYESLHQNYNMGIIYVCNKCFTISFVLSFAIHIVLGWLKIFAWISTALFCVSCIPMCILQSYASIVSYKYTSSEKYKKIHGRVAATEHKKSSVTGVVIMPIVTLFLCYVMIILVIDM